VGGGFPKAGDRLAVAHPLQPDGCAGSDRGRQGADPTRRAVKKRSEVQHFLLVGAVVASLGTAVVTASALVSLFFRLMSKLR